MLAEAAPNDAATCEGKLARSLEVALSFCKDPALSGLPYVPFLLQHSVNKEERVFRVDDGLFIASEHGAADVGLLRAFVTATPRLPPRRRGLHISHPLPRGPSPCAQAGSACPAS